MVGSESRHTKPSVLRTTLILAFPDDESGPLRSTGAEALPGARLIRTGLTGVASCTKTLVGEETNMPHSTNLLAVSLATGALVACTVAVRAQTTTPQQPQPDAVAPVDPTQDQRSTRGTAHPGESLSDRLERTGGVIRPPSDLDEGRTVRPPVSEPGTTPVIPPPGEPGGNPNVQPK